MRVLEEDQVSKGNSSECERGEMPGASEQREGEGPRKGTERCPPSPGPPPLPGSALCCGERDVHRNMASHLPLRHTPSGQRSYLRSPRARGLGGGAAVHCSEHRADPSPTRGLGHKKYRIVLKGSEI